MGSNEFTFLLSGFRYHDRIVKVNKSTDGKISLYGSPIEMCEISAPDGTKKNAAYAHSSSNGSLGASIVTTPSIFQIPKIVNKYAGYPRCVTLCTTSGIFIN